MSNQSGQITVDFLFSIFMAFSLMLLFFAISVTLSVVEITQYVAYSAARAQAAGHVDPKAQEDAARGKYNQLISSSALSSFYTGGWFTVSSQSELDVRQGKGALNGLTSNFQTELAGSATSDPHGIFMGVSTKLVAKVLNMRIPMLGSTSNDDADEGFATNVNAILIREPTQKECQKYYEDRAQALSQLPSGNSAFYNSQAYVPMEDNGC
ncbi:MAG: hypothetical protein BroJett040_25490 [Oligoflexia bacterium]|nr:MAG: hypothetical protein BroJett040_25490 [Oligoflexia bacterium]